jgi:RNA polymerase sigma-70 factor (ECF subfamily)
VLTEADILGALPTMRRYARKLTRGVVDAEDLTQDALTHAWAKRACYHGGDARASLFTMMHNVHLSRIRRISAQSRAVNTYAPAETSSLVDATGFFRLFVRDVARELQAMPEGMRQAVVLAAVSIDGYDGMAARLKVDPGTFRSRLSRGRQRLHRKFASAAVGRPCSCVT